MFAAKTMFYITFESIWKQLDDRRRMVIKQRRAFFQAAAPQPTKCPQDHDAHEHAIGWCDNFSEWCSVVISSCSGHERGVLKGRQMAGAGLTDIEPMHVDQFVTQF
jgi:hypothetical protein